MAFDAFIKIGEIEGESTDEQHRGWIEVTAYGLGIKQKISTTTSSAGGASAQRADFRELVIKKQLDLSSPGLARACADGTHIDEVILELCRAGGDKVKFMVYTLKNCMIHQVAALGGMRFPSETLRIVFGQIQWTYIRQKRAGGGPAGSYATGWDLERNRRM